MRGKYITINVLLACLTKRKGPKIDIHTQLRETIAEYRKTMRELKKLPFEQGDLFKGIGKEAA